MSPALDSPAPKPRNRLRKFSRRRPESIVSNVSPRVSTDSRRSSGESHSKPLPKSPSYQTTPPPPPDLSDPKWQEYVRKSGLLRPMEKSPHLEHTSSPSPSGLIPELAHLAVPHPPRTPIRADRLLEELPPLPSPHSTLYSSSSSAAASAAVRRYAKTPVTRIGQLEGEPSPTRLGHKASDVDSIAEQYRALIEARSYDSLQQLQLQQQGDHNNASSEQDVDEWHDARTRQNSLDTIRSAASSSRRSPRAPPPPTLLARPLTPPGAAEPDLLLDAEGSPTSDGTLVEFEEDAIYFKPAFSPEALSPILEDDVDLSSSAGGFSSHHHPPPASSSLGLQIAMELLTKELAGSLRRSNRRARAAEDGVQQQQQPPQPPPLHQTWLMIEAYEKLRDQVLEMHLPVAEAHALQDTFDVWLRALYRVHEGLAESTEGGEGMAQTKYVLGEDEMVEALQTVDLA